MDKDIEYDYIHIPKNLNNTFEKVYKNKKKEIKQIIKERIIKEHGGNIVFRDSGRMSIK